MAPHRRRTYPGGTQMDHNSNQTTEPAPVVIDSPPAGAVPPPYDQSTIEQPTIVLPAAGAPGPPMPPGPPIAPMGYPTAAVPPVPPPKGRGAGFWVGITAAIAAAAVLLLLAGFFIGRSTRLSDDQVQTKINQQAQADKIATQKALTDQADVLRTERIRLVRRAADRARGRGLRQGRSEGREQGFDDGQAQGFQAGQSSGYAQGQNDGYQSGISDGSCLANYFTC
jgi:hypothetical protein